MMDWIIYRKYFWFLFVRKVNRWIEILSIVHNLKRSGDGGLSFYQRHLVFVLVLRYMLGNKLEELSIKFASWLIFLYLLFQCRRLWMPVLSFAFTGAVDR